MESNQQLDGASGNFESVSRLTKDILSASTSLSIPEARFLVDTYYRMQRDRIRTNNQVSALSKSDEPHSVLLWLRSQSETLESQIKRSLQRFASGHPVGQWCLSIVGMGPVLSAGLLAHIDINKAPTTGHIWRFAGLDPTVKWERGQRRPFNARLKTLCWKIGESFVKVSGHEEDVYGKLYLARKEYEIANNLNGAYSLQALDAIKVKKFGEDTDAIIWYAGLLTKEDARQYYNTPPESRVGLSKRLAVDRWGKPMVFSYLSNRDIEGLGSPGIAMLPPAHIHSRAKRWAVKLFLAHLHDIWYREEFKKDPPLPYAIGILNHAHYIAPPNAAR